MHGSFCLVKWFLWKSYRACPDSPQNLNSSLIKKRLKSSSGHEQTDVFICIYIHTHTHIYTHIYTNTYTYTTLIHILKISTERNKHFRKNKVSITNLHRLDKVRIRTIMCTSTQLWTFQSEQFRCKKYYKMQKFSFTWFCSFASHFFEFYFFCLIIFLDCSLTVAQM